MLVTKSVISTNDIITYSASKNLTSTGSGTISAPPFEPGYLYTVIIVNGHIAGGAASRLTISLVGTVTIVLVDTFSVIEYQRFINNLWVYAKPGDQLRLWAQITIAPCTLYLSYQAIRIPST